MLQALFRGMDINKQHTCSIIDLVPYDSSLPRAVMELTSSEAEGCPRMCACSVVWTGVDQERQAIHRYIYSEVRHVMYKLSMQGTYKVPGMSEVSQVSAQDVGRPTYKEEDYKITKPQENNMLPLLQSVHAPAKQQTS